MKGGRRAGAEGPGRELRLRLRRSAFSAGEGASRADACGSRADVCRRLGMGQHLSNTNWTAG